MDKEKLLLLDGNSLTYRSFFALNVNNFTSHEGIPTNAIYGLKRVLDSIVKDLKPTKMLAAFDASDRTFRTELYSDYKGNRSKTPDELSAQFPYVHEMLKLMGITSYELQDYEADDIIGTLAKKANEQGIEVVIVTGDRDLTQLINDHTTVYITQKGFSNYETYNPDHLKEKLGITPKQVIDMKALTGDTSDNYPGVQGVGEKTALKLLGQYPNIEELYQHLGDLKPSKMKENLIRDQKQAFQSKELATIRTDAPIQISIEDTEIKPSNIEGLNSFFEKLDMKSLIIKTSNDENLKEKDVPAYQVLSLENISALKELKEPLIYFETFNSNYHEAEIKAMIIAERGKIFVTKDFSLLTSEILAGFEHIWTFDGKKTFILANRHQLSLPKISYDLMIASYVDDSGHSNESLATTIDDYFDEFILSDETVYGKGVKISLPENDQILYDHLAKKAEGYFLSKDIVDAHLKMHEQVELLKQIELPLSMVLAKMELEGIKLNKSELKRMGKEFDSNIHELKSKIFAEVGQEFNLNSPQQLADILFNVMKLPPSKKTKRGYSTSVEVLEELRPHSQVVDWILDYRQLSKLKSTYVDGLQKFDFGNGIIHTRFLQTMTSTGRLSSVDPNLQNIPARGMGKIIRKAFTARQNDWQLFSSDYSQIELRVLAHISGDPHMIKAFEDDRDIHQATAEKIYHLEPGAEITPDMRRVAKATNFGIVYGISDYGLAKNIGVTRKEAAAFINTYFEEYPLVKVFMDNSVKFAREEGYVETLSHRRRYLPDIHAKNFNLRHFAERTAMNTPIQGSAADIIKIAMVSIQNYLADQNLKSRMILQVHDELTFEVAPGEEEIIGSIVPKLMDSAIKLKVPLKVESHFGETWYDVH
ncbi:DNA polymerase I [Xylocopilactobacillus apicola]|uniref:DNA polymerase I n=1 Tax=Xylocopilactobacillus apicola TaxID=2932184 RepID=A0AAU9DJ74_9LACO|nr:DNA polymerase I [Xylocopilactobacillus apicola]BDR58516.1 DNA polymerase [Xylocopilactobacillus apicola]